MKRWSLLLTVILLFGINMVAMAQEDEERDLLEICVYGGLGSPGGGLSNWHDSLGATMGWSLGADFGYFFKSNLVIGFNFVYTQFGIDGPDLVEGAHHRLYNPNLFAKYYFVGESNFEPYVKAHVGIENAKFTTLMQDTRYQAISYDPVFAAGIGAGLFYYSADYSGVFLEVNYHYAATSDTKREYKDETLTFDETLGVLDVHAGVRLMIGSGE